MPLIQFCFAKQYWLKFFDCLCCSKVKWSPKQIIQCKSCSSEFSPYYIHIYRIKEKITYICFLYIDKKYMLRSLKCLLSLQEMNSSMKWHFYINFLAKIFPHIRIYFLPILSKWKLFKRVWSKTIHQKPFKLKFWLTLPNKVKFIIFLPPMHYSL